MKKVLIINGHPDKQSFNFALANAYKMGAEIAGASVNTIHLTDLDFNPSLTMGYRKRTELEPDLLTAIEQIKNADHLVWVFPLWWASFPAIMKGFIDRTFLPGITYEYVPGKPLPKGLLKGKTSRIITTSDTPGWYNYLYMKRPAIHQMKKGVLKFCGVSSVKVTSITPIKNSKESFRNNWLKKVEALGEKIA